MDLVNQYGFLKFKNYYNLSLYQKIINIFIVLYITIIILFVNIIYSLCVILYLLKIFRK